MIVEAYFEGGKAGQRAVGARVQGRVIIELECSGPELSVS